MTEGNILAGSGSSPRAAAAFKLEYMGVTHIPGVPDAQSYVNMVMSTFPQLGEMERNRNGYDAGINTIRQDGHLTEDQRLDKAQGVFDRARAAHEGLVQQLKAERDRRIESIDAALFGMGESGPGFRDALIRLQGATEEQLKETLDLAALTRDADLSRAVRAVAAHKGFEEVVRDSVFRTGSEYLQKRYTERVAMPNEGNLGVIANQFAPYPVTLTGLLPDRATKQRAEEEVRALEARRQRGVG